MENEYLAHHGIKGMKWGVRNAETLRKYGLKNKLKERRVAKDKAKGEDRKQKTIARNKAYMEEPGVAKHVKFDDEGYKIVGISKALQKELGTSVEDIDDDEMIFVAAMELEANDHASHSAMLQNAYLAHHGIKGMKWGVRNAETLRKYGDHVATKVTHLSKEERAQVKAAKAEQRHQSARRSLMTDDELRDYTKRLENQKKVRDLTSQELYPGRKAVKDTMTRYGGQAAAVVVGAAAGFAGQQIVKKYLSS